MRDSLASLALFPRECASLAALASFLGVRDSLASLALFPRECASLMLDLDLIFRGLVVHRNS